MLAHKRRGNYALENCMTLIPVALSVVFFQRQIRVISDNKMSIPKVVS